jgi:hypothetical protein
MTIGTGYNESGHSGYGGNPAGMGGGGSPTKSSDFWNMWLSTQQSNSGGVGAQLGSLGGGAIGTAIGGPVGGQLGSTLGSIAGAGIEGAMGEDETGEDKLAEERAQSELETRRWEERNAAPSAGAANYLGRAMMFEGYPILGAINSLDFLMNKVAPYMNNYILGRTDKYGNPSNGRKKTKWTKGRKR